MSFYGNRALGRPMGVFSAFGGGGREIFGPFSFSESWSSDDFEGIAQFNQAVKPYLDQVNRKDLQWSPLSSTIITAASAAWSSFKNAADAGDASSAAYMANITGQMNDLIARGDALSLQGTLGHRSEAVEVSRYDVFNQIQTLVKQVAAQKAKAAAAVAAANAAANYVPPAPVQTSSAGMPQTTSNIIQNPQQNPINPIGSTYGASTADTGDNTLLYVGLGVGALALIGGVLMFKKKSPAVAGYRRRSRR